jgi:hypothetical protein
MASKRNFSTTYPQKHLTSNWKYLPRLQSHVVGKCRQPETKPQKYICKDRDAHVWEIRENDRHF